MTKRTLNRIGYFTAGLTFVIASSIMIGYYNGGSVGGFERTALISIFVTFVINLIVLIFILVSASIHRIAAPFRSIYFMLLNIPYAIACTAFALYLMGICRVTVMNDTPHRITNIELSGCDEMQISTLESGESETVWIDIPHDCSVDIRYLNNKKDVKKDRVVGYLTSGMGGVVSYHISGKSNPKY